jgi:branched-chain amino acid transport system substrate-binding protein
MRRVTTCLAVGLSPTLGLAPAAAGSGRTADGALVLASLAPETGELAPLLESLRAPVRLAVDEINAAGGIEGAPVTLLTGDEGGDPALTHQTLAALIEAGADAIVGPASSSTARVLLDDVRGRTIVCSGTNSAASLTRRAPRRAGGRYFRVAPPDGLQGRALAELILAAGHRRVAVIAREGPDGMARALVRSLRDGDANVPVVARPRTDADVAAAGERALAEDPDAVAILASRDGGAAIVRELAAAGAGPQQVPTYATATLRSSGFGALVDPADPGIVAGLAGVAPAAAPANVASPFHEALAATGIESVFSAHAYDCTILLALAAAKAESDDPARMAAAFASNLKGANDCDTFAGCRDLLAAGQTIHYRGASSRFDRFGRFEPREGVYQPWAYDSGGVPRDGDPSSQITVTRSRPAPAART